MKINLNFEKLIIPLKTNRFSAISWGVTALVVAALLGSALWQTQAGSASAATRPVPTAKADQIQSITLPAEITSSAADPSIERHLQLKTNIPERPRAAPVNYRVIRGDSMFSIAKDFNIKPESILYSNQDTLKDNLDSLKPGMELTIPPMDGLYYLWKEGDTIESVAAQFKANVDDILNFPGNNIDLTNPQIKPGTMIMIPGGQRELVDWSKFIPTITRNPAGGTGTSELSGSSCAGGPTGPIAAWPVNARDVSGNEFTPGHLALDLRGSQGDPVYAAANGVVTMAQGGDNYGYGLVIQIDHGNGLSTLYAHLSQINVSPCQAVYAGQVIGLVGNTGNSFGAHLHFEVRVGGANQNPWYYLP